jgi:hypothetical protein
LAGWTAQSTCVCLTAKLPPSYSLLLKPLLLTLVRLLLRLLLLLLCSVSAAEGGVLPAVAMPYILASLCLHLQLLRLKCYLASAADTCAAAKPAAVVQCSSSWRWTTACSGHAIHPGFSLPSFTAAQIEMLPGLCS